MTSYADSSSGATTEPGQASGRSGSRRVVIVGAGITGLSTAYRLHELDPSLEVVILDGASHPGGVLHTRERDGFLLEEGADNFITAFPWGLQLARRLGLEDELLSTNPRYRSAFVVRRGRLHKIPDGFYMMAPTRAWPMLLSPILSPLGKLRLACEPLIPRKPTDEEESLESFATRRLGRETFERLVQPLVGGIYVGDPKRLSATASVERFVTLERECGSLTRGMWKSAHSSASANGNTAGGGARYSLFVTFRRGMSTLIDRLVSTLPAGSLQCDTAVRRIERNAEGRWLVHAEGPAPRSWEAEAVIVATPAAGAAKLLRDVSVNLAGELEQMETARCALVSLAFRRDQISHPLDGFGLVVPSCEKRNILSASFSSIKYEGRAPEGFVLLRSYLGGALQPELVSRTDDELCKLAVADLQQFLGIRGEPLLRLVTRPAGMPQYYLGHLARVERVEQQIAALPGLALVGNSYRGVGIPQCIRSGDLAAERIVAGLAAR